VTTVILLRGCGQDKKESGREGGRKKEGKEWGIVNVVSR